MGQHKGWTVAKQGDKWVCRVWQPDSRRYKSKSFDRQGDAAAHGKAEAGKIAAGVRVAERWPTRTADLARDFIRELEELGRSPRHVHETQRMLTELAKDVPDLAASNSGTLISNWLAAQRLATDPAKPISPATRNRHLVMIRALCSWAIRWKRMTEDPTAPIRQATVPDPLPAVFTVDELRQLLAKTRYKVVRPGNDPADPYHLFFAVMAYTGLRRGEASGLHAEDLDWSGRSILVRLRVGTRIKRQRERIVPLQDELATLLAPWKGRQGPIFKKFSGNPYRSFASFLKRAGVTLGDRHPHSCRHTYAGLMTATGVPGPLLSCYLGHSSAATTLGYTRLSQRFVRSVEGWGRGELRLAAQAMPSPGKADQTPGDQQQDNPNDSGPVVPKQRRKKAQKTDHAKEVGPSIE